MTVIAEEDVVRASQRRALAADYARLVADAVETGVDVEVVAVHEGETKAWAIDPKTISVAPDAISFATPEGRVVLAVVGPSAPAVLPMLTLMGQAWRHRDAARGQMRRIGFDADGPRMVRVADDASNEHARATMVMINGVGIFPPSLQGITWDETTSLHSSGDVLTVRDPSRSLSVS